MRLAGAQSRSLPYRPDASKRADVAGDLGDLSGGELFAEAGHFAFAVCDDLGHFGIADAFGIAACEVIGIEFFALCGLGAAIGAVTAGTV